MEIGDAMEVEETGSEQASTRSSGATTSRRKNGRNGAKGRNGKRSGAGGYRHHREHLLVEEPVNFT